MWISRQFRKANAFEATNSRSELRQKAECKRIALEAMLL
jgi:hypothetical protein